ncbi:MAG: FtsW/RodA/SpoVE family cell cycle protein [Clostridiales bacterium]|nr:FtsW/RodA/SpoVE family cell cycle protein [Clostridiales bacterium]
MSIRRQWQSFDFLLVLMIIGFAIFGVLMVGAASSYSTKESVIRAYGSQKLFFASGLVILAVVTAVDYHFIARFYWLIYGVMIALLIAVLILGEDDPTGTARWFRFSNFTIQPSEFSKIFIIIFLAKFIDKLRDSINNIGVLAVLAALVVVPVVLIMRQPSLSASLVIVFISVCVIFSSNLKPRYILIALSVVIPILCLFIWDLNNEDRVFIDEVLGHYQVDRIETFLNPERNSDEFYQTSASLTSIGSGMLEGKGYRQGSNIPAGVNDFIFSVVGEQFGFVGCAGVLIVFFIIISKCIIIANRSPDTLGRLMAMGVAGKLAFEAFVNVGVATDIMPNTGMPFPFLSSGGSSMWVNMACIGLVLNIGLFKAKSIFKG